MPPEPAFHFKSHTGIHGNDEADGLAKEATDPKMPIDTHVTQGEIAHEGMAWPSMREEIPATTAPAFGPRPPAHRWRQAANLTADIKNKAPPGYSTGYAKTDGMYASSWKKIIPTLHKASSSHYWKDHNVPYSLRRLNLNCRWGGTYTKRRPTGMASRMPRTPCPQRTPSAQSANVEWMGPATSWQGARTSK